MSEATMHVNSETATEAQHLRGRTRTCVGCGARVEVDGPDGADLVRLVLGPGGEIAVDAGSRHGGGFGRGAHVHARRACVERAAKAGLLRATKGAVRSIDTGESEKGEPLGADSLARAIQRSMDRRIEGLLAAAVRSRQVALGASAVTAACRSGEARLCLVACDGTAAADLAEIRRAVAEGRAVAWGNKTTLGAIIAPAPVRGTLRPPAASPPADVTEAPRPPVTVGETPNPPAQPVSEGLAVVAILSPTIAEALRAAVQAASAVTSAEVITTGPQASGGRSGRAKSPGAASEASPRAPRSPERTKPQARRARRGERGPTGPGGASRTKVQRRDG